MLPQINFLFFIDALRLILRRFKMEVYTARLSIWVVKEDGGGEGGESKLVFGVRGNPRASH